MNSAIAVLVQLRFFISCWLCPKIPENRQWLGHRRREKKSAFVPFASFPLSSEQCKDACEYQEKGHHSGDNKQQEFAEEVWFHQLISPHGTTSNLHCRSSLNWPENTIQ